MIVETINSQVWNKWFAENAHMACFKESRPSSVNRIDFALLAVDQQTPVAYMTIRENDDETCYVQFGGAFESIAGTVKVFTSYTSMLNKLGEKYKAATTLIENTNSPMLKLAIKAGWLITGLRNWSGKTLLEHTIYFKED